MTKSRPQYASVNSLEEINTIKIGDTVRSFDMEFMPFSWVEGEVVGTEVVDGCERYVVEVSEWKTCRDENGIHNHVVEIEYTPEKSKRRKVYPPVNGTRLMFGKNTYSNFVERV